MKCRTLLATGLFAGHVLLAGTASAATAQQTESAGAIKPVRSMTIKNVAATQIVRC